jgi:hypothetical protein
VKQIYLDFIDARVDHVLSGNSAPAHLAIRASMLRL